MPPRTPRNPYQVQVIDRSLALLDRLAEEEGGLTLLELSERLVLHKSTVHRLLMVLERHRVVEKRNGRYGLGLKLFELGSRAASHVRLGPRARPYLERLAVEIGETAHLCVLDDDEVFYLEKVEPTRSIRVPTSVGRRNPAHCTAVGKAMLAFLPPRRLEALVRRRGLRAFTRNTRTNLRDLRRDLALVRERGYAVDSEEIEEGLVCIGAPVRDHTGEVVAALSIAGPAFRLTRRKVPGSARIVLRVAGELSASLGHRG